MSYSFSLGGLKITAECLLWFDLEVYTTEAQQLEHLNSRLIFEKEKQTFNQKSPAPTLSFRIFLLN